MLGRSLIDNSNYYILTYQVWVFFAYMIQFIMAAKTQESAALSTETFTHDSLHLRSVAESLLKQPFPLLTPDSTLAETWAKTLTPFSQDQQPIIILDLDDSLWPHVKHLVKAISSASNTPITMDHFRSIGHTRKIPEWQTPEISNIHDAILSNRHPKYLPYVNFAYQNALNTIAALKQLNCHLAYLTSRPLETYDLTLKTLKLNSLPHIQPQSLPDALSDPTPQPDHLYCTPFHLPSGTQYKRAAVDRWLINLYQTGSKKLMVIIDDLLKPFRDIIDKQTIYGISLANDLNHHTQPYDHEIRCNNWIEINQYLYDILYQHQTSN